MDDFLDVRDMLLQERVSKTDAEAKHKRHIAAIERYIEQNKERVVAWYKDHPGKMPPVFYIESEDRVIWLTREQERKLKRLKRMSPLEQDLLARSLTRRAGHFPKSSNSTSPNGHQKEDEDETRPTPGIDPGADGGSTEDGNGPAGESDFHGNGD